VALETSISSVPQGWIAPIIHHRKDPSCLRLYAAEAAGHLGNAWILPRPQRSI